MHIINADKLLEFVEAVMCHSKICADVGIVNSNGEYDAVSDMIRHMDLFTYNQLKVVKDYIIENMI